MTLFKDETRKSVDDIDGMALDGNLLETGGDMDGAPLDDEPSAALDGLPLDGDPLDGVPCKFEYATSNDALRRGLHAKSMEVYEVWVIVLD